MMGGKVRKYSTEEVYWANEVIERLEGKVGLSRLKKEGILKEYKEKFKQEKSPGAIYNWLRILARKKGYSSQKKPAKKKKEDVFRKSEFLVYVEQGGLFGFDTPDEVKEFIIKSQIVSGVKLFKRIHLNVKVEIEEYET